MEYRAIEIPLLPHDTREIGKIILVKMSLSNLLASSRTCPTQYSSRYDGYNQ
jgi:hypothetical protein